jgi:hypothetical protein
MPLREYRDSTNAPRTGEVLHIYIYLYILICTCIYIYIYIYIYSSMSSHMYVGSYMKQSLGFRGGELALLLTD